ncbi:MAG: sorbitol-6-phosphate dehydrogenase [Chloroflexota bacterium]|nr:sorbitol-6-phosphate dehydrogenase [Chloroflexota bacterium]
MEEKGQLCGKTAIVTGGAQGLGQAISLRLALEGCNVVVADINQEGIKETEDQIRKQYSQETLGIVTDVTQEAEVERLVDQTIRKFGILDIMVSNAGILFAQPVDEFLADKWMKVMEVNLFGYFLCLKHAARVMKKQRSGVIIQINSKSGKKGSYKNSAYAASKFGGIGLTQSVALELAEFSVRVNAICPGNMLDSPLWVDSLFKQYAQTRGMTEEAVRQYYIDQVPMKRGCTYEDVCNVLVFLASDKSSYMTGQAINVTGGQEMN